MKTLEAVAGPGRAFAMGPFGSNIKTENFVQSGVPVIQGRNLKGTRLDENDFVFLTDEKTNELSASVVKSGDIVITHRGTLGQVVMIPRTSRYPRYVVSQSQMKVSVDEDKMSPEFVTYWLQSSIGQAELFAYASQTGVPAIAQPLASLRKMRVICPPLDEQRAIVGVLEALDDKIESNRQQVRVLDELMVSVYQASLSGDLVPFLEVASPVSGGTPRRSEPEFWTPEIPWASAKDISAASAGVILSTLEQISQSGLSNSAAELVPAGTTIITARGTVGAVARLGMAATFNQSCYGLIPADPRVHYLEVYLSTRAGVDELKRSSHGTVFDTITRQTFELLKVQRPDERSRTQTVTELESLDRLVIARLRESSKVMELRDTLLPELLSGRLRVRDAEKVVEGAA